MFLTNWEHENPGKNHQGDVCVDGGLVIGMRKVCERVLFLGPGLVGISHFHAPVAAMAALIAAVRKDRRNEQSENRGAS